MVKKFRICQHPKGVPTYKTVGGKLVKTGYKKKLTTKVVKKLVKKELHKNIENKEYRVSGSNSKLFSYASSTLVGNNYQTNNIFDTGVSYLNINQGTGQAQRIGNRIKIAKWNYQFKLVMNTTDYDVPMLAKMYLVTYKFAPNDASTIDIWSSLQSSPGNANNFYQNGNSSNGQTGNLLDMMMPVNTDVMTVHTTRTYKLGASSNPVGNGNNDFKLMCSGNVNLAKYHAKNIRYNDTSTSSFNKKMFIIWEIVRSDGVPTPDTNPHMAFLTWTYDFRYEDA